jgi:hypothetical protein
MDMGNFCMVKQFVPYPGGLVNTRGGWIPQKYDEMVFGGSRSQANRVNYFFGYSGSNREHGIPGMGGMTAGSWCGYCYCGGSGHAGQVIITYG